MRRETRGLVTLVGVGAAMAVAVIMSLHLRPHKPAVPTLTGVSSLRPPELLAPMTRIKCTGFGFDLRPAAEGAGVLHVDEATISELFLDVQCKDSAAVRVTLRGEEHVIVRWDGRVEIYGPGVMR